MAGCTDLSNPRVATDSVNLQDDDTPTILLWEALRDAGWSAQDGVVLHDREGRTYQRSSKAARKEYLRVRLRWRELALPGMPSDRPGTYYRCVLQGLAVPHDQPAAYYASQLRAASGAEAVARAPQLEDVVAPAAASQASRRRPRPAAGEDVVETLDSEPPPGSPVAVGADAAECSSASDSTSSSTEDPTSDPAETSETEPEGAEDVVDAEPSGAPASSWPSTLEGVHLGLEVRPGQYERLAVRCRYHTDCTKRRNTGAAQTTSLGPREPLAFLATWLQAGSSCSRAEHRVLRPALADQRAWLESHPE